MKAGWEVRSLGDLCEMYQPKTLTKKELAENGQFPVFGANGIMGWHDQFNHVDPELLIGCRGACGTVHISSPNSWITGNSMVVRPRSGSVLREFLRYFFLGPANLNEVVTGAAQPQITQASLKPIAVPLPPLDEQKRIVAVLDEAFEGLSRARANAEANLADARELFESYLAREFSDPPPDWKRASLGSLCRQMTVGHVGPMADRYTDTGIPFLRSQNIKPFRVDLTDVKFIGPEFMSELKKSELRPGDVAIVRTGYPGTCTVIPDELELANCADLVIARTGPDLDPHFMALLLNSRYGKEHVAEVSVGAAQKHFNVGAAKSAVFPIPPIAVQREFVEMAKQVRDQGTEIEHASIEKEKLIDALRQSLLQKAFSGDLTR